MQQRVLLTGGSGFWGQHLKAALEKREYNVVAPTRHELNLVYDSWLEIWSYINGIRPDYIIHAAADCGGLPYNKANPYKLYSQNIMMGMNLLEAITSKTKFELNIKKFVNFGTICMYPKVPDTIPFKESSLFNGFQEETNAPYALAKQGIMIAGNAARQQHGLPFITVMPTNTYGPGDCVDLERSHIIGAALNKINAAKQNIECQPPTFLGTGEATRDFLYIEDGVEAVISAMENYDEPTPLNIGSGKETSIKEIVECIAFWMGYHGYIRWSGDASMNGQPRRVLDISLAKEKLNWYPKHTLDEGIKKTVEWYNEQYQSL